MNEQQWLDWRRSGLGASDAPIIMGVSPYKSLNQLWKDKVLGEKQEDNPAMARGRALEGPALDFFMSETGIFMETQKRFEHPERNWMRCTIDGINEEDKVLLEIKSCNLLHEEVPERYYPQLQHQMEVLGYDKMFYLSYNGVAGKILEVKKDEEYVKRLVQKETDFWEKVKLGCKSMEDDENWIFIKERFKALKIQKEEIKEEEAFLLSQALLFSDGIPSVGNGLVLAYKTRKGTINYKKIPQIEALDLEHYRGPDKNYWSLELQE